MANINPVTRVELNTTRRNPIDRRPIENSKISAAQEVESLDLTVNNDQKMSLPTADKLKFGIKDTDITEEIDSQYFHTFILNDGRTLKYAKNSDGNLVISQITTKNESNQILSVENFDIKGNLTTTKKYTYDKTGHFTTIETEDKVAKTITREQYTNDGKTIKVTDSRTNKILNTTAYDINGNEISRNSYGYDENGQMIVLSSYDSKTKKGETKYFENGKETFSFPFDIIGSDVNAGSFNDYYSYDGVTRLSQPLNTVLSAEDIEEINNRINENVDSAGRGTGEGVAAAAVTLITELHKRNIILPYYYSGGHVEGGPPVGVDETWGSTVVSKGISTYRDRKSLDCSGFTTWSIKTGGIDCEMINTGLGTNVSYEQAGPGDVLANSDHYIVVVNTYIDSGGQKHLICAEATGNGANEAINNGDKAGGIMLSDRTDASGYGIYNMDNYYKENNS